MKKPGPPHAQKTPTAQIVGICIGLAVLCAVVFGQVVGHAFIFYDDNEYVFENPMVKQGLTGKGFVWAFNGAHAANWHPLTWLSHMLDCQLYGLRAGGHHSTSLLIHTATVIVLFLVLRKMTGALWKAAFIAAVFAIHPLRAESVAWVAERKDVLSGFFFVLTLAAYLRYVRLPFSWARYALALLLFALGLMSKSMLVTLPLILLLLDYWPLRREKSLGKLVVEKIPFALLSAATCLATIYSQNKDKALQSIDAYSVPVRLANALVSYVIYLRQMVWPFHLTAFYPFDPSGVPPVEWIFSAIILLGITSIVLWQRRSRPWLLTGWIWYIAMLLPVIGIVQVGSQAHADRYTYLPQIGIYIAITWLAGELALKRIVKQTHLAIGAGLLIGVLAYCGWKQTSYWRNGKTLWLHAIECTPNNDTAYNSLGLAYRQDGEMDEALQWFEKAVEINPDCADAHNNIALILVARGQYDEAIVHCEKALGLHPYYKQTHINLGNAFARKGQYAAAVSEYSKALEIDPDYAEAHNDLANVLLAEGKIDDAIAQYHIALEISPDYADARYNLGIALADKSKSEQKPAGSH